MGRTQDIITRIMVLIGQDITNSNWSDSQATSETRLLIELNEGYEKIAKAKDWDWLKDTDVKVLPYTTTTTGTSTGTNLYAASRTNMYIGQKLVVGSSLFENVEALTVNSSPVTLVSPGLVSSYASGEAKIGAASVQKPTDCYKLIAVRLQSISSTENSVTLLTRETERGVFDYQGEVLDLGAPTHYIERENDLWFNCGVDDSYTYKILIDYIKVPADLALSAEVEPAFSKYYDDLLVNYGQFAFYQRINNLQLARVYESRFYDLLKAMIADDAERHDEEPVIRTARQAAKKGLR